MRIPDERLQLLEEMQADGIRIGALLTSEEARLLLAAYRAPVRHRSSGRLTEDHLKRIEREIERERGGLETITGQQVVELVTEVRRLRALLSGYDERRRGRCDWCGSSLDHEETCPAFMPTGAVK